MIKCKHLCMMLLLALCTLTAQAQEAERMRNGDF